uniref:Uncharacterized protein n=1 Tax=Equus asinus asinus TaxID=83772 RepID=A0A8C4LCS9_EQUAS
MEGPAQVAAVEPAPTRTGPAGPSGGSDSGDKVQRVAMSLSVSWERAGPEEAEAPIRGEAAPHPGISPTAARTPPGRMGAYPTGRHRGASVGTTSSGRVKSGLGM